MPSPDRRRFGGALLGALAVVALPATAGATRVPSQGKKPMSKPQLTKPPRLEPGDLVGIVAPGGHTSPQSIAKAVRNIEALGLRVTLGEHINAVHGNYGGTVAQRLEDLHGMFADPQVNAIWAIRGGSGCISLLPHIDYQLIRANPKVLIGYSDITALHLAINKHAGLVTFHGPVASSTFSEYAVTQLRNVLMTPQERYTISMSQDNAHKAAAEPQYALRTVHGGQCTGRLTGGNLCLVSALEGTPYAADIKGSILFLEEVNEAPYRIDRMLMQLQLSQGLKNTAGVMLGIFENCEGQDEDISLTLNDTVDQHLQPLTQTAVAGYSFGHIRHQFTIPMGVLATLDAEQQTLTLLEPAVS
ncbi:LD-carboxypeptidase [Pseudoduganella sp. LjRoot289]|uniref:S66 peptidase family protein n=1 Tax=Pseudoduganella sp. LjRoot289 TaxID=3342314 RepID=UPI003ECFCDFF